MKEGSLDHQTTELCLGERSHHHHHYSDSKHGWHYRFCSSSTAAREERKTIPYFRCGNLRLERWTDLFRNPPGNWVTEPRFKLISEPQASSLQLCLHKWRKDSVVISYFYISFEVPAQFWVVAWVLPWTFCVTLSKSLSLSGPGVPFWKEAQLSPSAYSSLLIEVKSLVKSTEWWGEGCGSSHSSVCWIKEETADNPGTYR